MTEARAPDALDKAPAALDTALAGMLDMTLEAMAEEAIEEPLEGAERAAPAATRKPCKTCIKAMEPAAWSEVYENG